jgi:hypothetical protein
MVTQRRDGGLQNLLGAKAANPIDISDISNLRNRGTSLLRSHIWISRSGVDASANCFVQGANPSLVSCLEVGVDPRQ